MTERPDPDDTDHEPSPVPEDAPVETPEADPRTEGAPDGGEPRSVEKTGEPEGAEAP